ncbi:MAG: triose-phosphate isomerase, partial [Candidatus Nealsonbacteria bacterium CG09_land_8_20_14_0_10_42_14]
MKPLIVANWKMNPTTLKEAKFLFDKVKSIGAVICPPFVYVPVLKSNGAQDVFWEDAGAFTGEISPPMLKDLGVKYVIIGHSERRKHQKETNEMIDKKIKATMAVGLKPILCIDKISQIPKGIKKGLIIAYEPLFAIGTGKACSPEKA